ncbi:hypothetical protein D9M70_648220 [compost metagenome]
MPQVSKAEFIRLLNDALRQAPGYREGMRFVAHPDPDRPEQASGYDFVPKERLTVVFAAVANRISAQYTVE